MDRIQCCELLLREIAFPPGFPGELALPVNINGGNRITLRRNRSVCPHTIKYSNGILERTCTFPCMSCTRGRLAIALRSGARPTRRDGLERVRAGLLGRPSAVQRVPVREAQASLGGAAPRWLPPRIDAQALIPSLVNVRPLHPAPLRCPCSFLCHLYASSLFPAEKPPST